MAAKIIDGKSIAAQVRRKIHSQIQAQVKRGKKSPGLAMILVGKDPASQVYVRNKHQACQEVGIRSFNYSLPARVSQKKLIELIHKLNHNPSIHGILLQLPLPQHLNSEEILEHIRPDKDVDGFHAFNVGRMAQNRPAIQPCTPYGVMLMLEHIKQKFQGKHAVIVGSSNIVGKPMAFDLLAAGCTITICHRFTKKLPHFISEADILVTAIGKPGFIKGKWIKKGATVIDVGITMLPGGKVTGDIEFDKARLKAKWITPVPGGVGPMTVAVLLKNTLLAQEIQDGK